MSYLRQLQLRRAYYAPDGAGGGTSTGATGEENAAPQDTPSEENDTTDEGKPDKAEKLLPQSEVQRIVNKTIAEERARAEKQVEAARLEAERLAALSTEERTQEERRKQAEAMAKREAEILRRELRAGALETLTERELPKELADILNYADEGKCSTSLETVEKAFRVAVQRGVETRLKTKEIPKMGGGDGSTEAAFRAAAGLPVKKE